MIYDSTYLLMMNISHTTFSWFMKYWFTVDLWTVPCINIVNVKLRLYSYWVFPKLTRCFIPQIYRKLAAWLQRVLPRRRWREWCYCGACCTFIETESGNVCMLLLLLLLSLPISQGCWLYLLITDACTFRFRAYVWMTHFIALCYIILFIASSMDMQLSRIGCGFKLTGLTYPGWSIQGQFGALQNGIRAH